jgi:hypothetical protein
MSIEPPRHQDTRKNILKVKALSTHLLIFAEYSDILLLHPCRGGIIGENENPGVTRFSRHPWLLSIVPSGQEVVTIFCDSQ